MALVIALDIIILLELGTSIYNYSDIKKSQYNDDENGEKSKKLALTNILITSIVLALINTLYFIESINPKRTVLNLILLSVVSSIFIYISYNYLELQSQSHPSYEASKQILIDNTENINQKIKNFNLIIASNTIIITVLILSFYVGYKFFSRLEIKELDKPFIIFKRKNKSPKLKLKI